VQRLYRSYIVISPHNRRSETFLCSGVSIFQIHLAHNTLYPNLSVTISPGKLPEMSRKSVSRFPSVEHRSARTVSSISVFYRLRKCDGLVYTVSPQIYLYTLFWFPNVVRIYIVTTSCKNQPSAKRHNS